MMWIHQIFGQTVPGSHLTAIFTGSYVLGCICAGYYLVRLRTGQDIRETGSGNVGARNVGRLLGAPGFLATLFVDFFKGTLAVWTTRYFTDDNRLAGMAMLAVVVGHIWPIQLGFRGGKGVATLLGAIVVYDFYLALTFAAIFGGLFLLLRRTTLAGLIAIACLPLAATFQQPEPLRAGIVSVLAGIIWFAHRRNLLEEFTVMMSRRHVETKPDRTTE